MFWIVKNKDISWIRKNLFNDIIRMILHDYYVHLDFNNTFHNVVLKWQLAYHMLIEDSLSKAYMMQIIWYVVADNF